MAELALTTQPGLEDLVVAELRERVVAAGHDPAAVAASARPVPGRVVVTASLADADLRAAARELRSVHHLLEPLGRATLPAAATLDDVRAAVAGLPTPEALRAGASFRVSSTRRGDHPFRSPDVERAAGAVWVAATGAPVDLTGFDVELRVDVFERTCLVARQLTRRPLSRRRALPYRQRITLQPPIAWAALRLAGVGPGTRRLLDPFCGAGTILLEAGDLHPELELWGSDRSPQATAGARENLAAAGLGARSRVEEVAARDLEEAFPPGSVDAVVTNPPYGLRLGKTIDFGGFYRGLLPRLRTLLRPGGRVGLLAHKKGALVAACRASRAFYVADSLAVATGELRPTIFVLAPR